MSTQQDCLPLNGIWVIECFNVMSGPSVWSPDFEYVSAQRVKGCISAQGCTKTLMRCRATTCWACEYCTCWLLSSTSRPLGAQ